jgi:hypothetical protein
MLLPALILPCLLLPGLCAAAHDPSSDQKTVVALAEPSDEDLLLFWE